MKGLTPSLQPEVAVRQIDPTKSFHVGLMRRPKAPDVNLSQGSLVLLLTKVKANLEVINHRNTGVPNFTVRTGIWECPPVSCPWDTFHRL